MVRISALPRRTANRPGSQRMARYKITDFLKSASADRHAADGDRPRFGAVPRSAPRGPVVRKRSSRREEAHLSSIEVIRAPLRRLLRLLESTFDYGQRRFNKERGIHSAKKFSSLRQRNQFRAPDAASLAFLNPP